MALKADRYEADTDISFFCDTLTGSGSTTRMERGVVLSLYTAGSGAGMDSSKAIVRIAAQASGAIPIGVLMNDVVDLDLTRQKLNPYGDEVQKGGKVRLLKRGWVVTNKITGTPTAGARAYLGDSGVIRPTQGINEAPMIGRFLSKLDENNFAKVEIQLPPPTLAPPITAAGIEDTL